MEDCCAVCAEPLEWLAYGPCGHREVCSTCTARMRVILDDKCCCICKQECPIIFVTKALGDYTKTIGDFNALQAGANEGQVGDYWFHADMQAYFDDEEQYKMIKLMCRLCCSVCEKSCGSHEPGKDLQRSVPEFKHIDRLRRHLFHVHKLHMCTLCLEGRKAFICEQRLYTREQLKQHLATGNSAVDGNEIERGGFTGHPLCSFCRKRFYGDNELYIHMSTEHYTCHICQRRHPGHFEYFQTYDDLEGHFRQEHFLCENGECLAKKFVVFANEPELKRHNAMEHAGNMSRSQRNAACQIPINFQSLRLREEREPHRGGRQGQGRGSNEHLFTANQASIEAANLDSVMSATTENIYTSRESEPLLPSSEVVPNSSTSTPNDPPRYLAAVSRRARNSPLEDSAFPPLPGALENAGPISKNNAQRSGKSMASLFHGSRERVRVLNATESRQGMGSGQHSSSYALNSSLNQTTSNRNMNQLVMPKVSGANSRLSGVMNGRETLLNPALFPPVSGKQNVATVTTSQNQSAATGNMSLLTDEETRTANKALVESIRSGLGENEHQYAAFKDLSAQFRNGSLTAERYCAHISELGLSHLVPELARLCPDEHKRRQLQEAHKAGFKTTLQYTSNQGSSPIIGGSNILENGDSRGKGKAVDDAGCSEDATSRSHAESVGRTKFVESSSDDVEILSKDGYRSAKGKLKSRGTSEISGQLSDDAGNHISPKVLVHVPDSQNSYFGDKWSCPACTLLNKAENNSCLMCGTVRTDCGPIKETSYGRKEKQKKRASKFQSVPLGDSSATTEVSQRPSGGGVWGNGGGQRLVSMAQRDSVVD